MIGTTVSHYKILEKLGEGGMGVVYKALDTKLNRTVALKFLPPHLVASENEKIRFIHEAQAASALDHPNICTVHEINETEDGRLYIVMSYYDGNSLKQEIERDPLEIERAIKMAFQIAEGLHSAHRKNIVHRDIKPANILLPKEGPVKIVDFGLAKLSGQTQVTKAGSTVGTVAYMSPEQAQGNPVDHRTDIWALGVTMYEMLTGQVPFKSDYRDAVVYSIINEQPRPVSELLPDISEAIEDIIHKCLEKDPDKRYQSMSELKEDIEILLRPDGEHYRPSYLRKSLSRRRRRGVAFGGVILALVAFLAIYWFTGSRTAFSFIERDWILITDFENQTGEEIFDRSLGTALSVSIGQSRYVNILPGQKIRETLQRMEKEVITHIDETTGREIAERAGVKILIVPSISRIGGTYVLTAVVRDVVDETVYTSEIVHASNEDEVLGALDKLANRIRRTLGESLLSVTRESRPLAQVTTSSVEALKQYTLGDDNHRGGNFQDAKMYYENALRIDSTFVLAKAGLGIIHIGGASRNLPGFDGERGKDLVSEAIDNIERLTEKEKYSLLIFHAGVVERDYEKGIQYCRAFLVLYPEYSSTYNNLGWFHEQLGKYTEAAEMFKEAIRIDPSLMVSFNGIVNLYTRLIGDVDSALTWSRRWVAEHPESHAGWTYLGWAYLGKDSLQQAEAASKEALEYNPRGMYALYNLAHIYRIQGKYREAIQTLEKILDVAPWDAWAHYQLGVLYRALNDDRSSGIYYQNFQTEIEKWIEQDPANSYNYYVLGLLLARMGEPERGWEMAGRGIGIDDSQHFVYAQLLTQHGKIQEAIDQLELAVENGYRDYITMKIHIDFQPLHNEPRFIALVNREFER